MNTKLTLTIEKEIIEEAKVYAREKGQSLSDIVENYLKLLTKEQREIKPKQLSPRVQRLRGILKVDEDFDYKKVVEEELSKKYDL
ncbi:MAG TPA: DUF6364 family protein [Saprospiraceae bacterium]|nr:hypothetical protein [Saprospiraceae bacterium]MCB9271078.1 hypothetical protein [Lewinellaceae bacterium]HPG07040.1 DUF6364 family protein [Saprospiraceae bacterium]HPQ99403.1 DUF6364 family protein [Saprospiraceae bacterium]HQU54245.1 DUF6364 family protein [Saprospiraceae bacterium]